MGTGGYYRDNGVAVFTSKEVLTPLPREVRSVVGSGYGLEVATAIFSCGPPLLTIGLEPILLKEQILNLPCLPVSPSELQKKCPSPLYR